MSRSYSIGTKLNKSELIAGLLYLPFYVCLLTLLLELGFRLLELELTHLQFNAVWFVCNALFVWIIFHRFLLRSFRGIRFWDLVQAVILGGALYWALSVAVTVLFDALKLQVVSFNDEAVQSLALDNYYVMLICSVIIAPVVEETLCRGLIFGALRPKSRLAAYLVSILFFSVIHVWQYIPTEGLGPVLLAAAQYAAPSVALAWTYEKSGTVWGPILLHMANNAIGMGLLQ